MKWQVDIAVWTDKPSVIQAYSDTGEECDYLPERTCHKANPSEPDWFVCSECGCQCRGDKWRALPNYCANCGARVVERGEL